MPFIEIKTAAGQFRKVELTEPRYVLGRDPGCNLAFPEDVGLSRQHLALQSGNGGWEVQDLNSRNGCFVNNERVSGSRTLEQGDIIKAGTLQILYKAQDRSGVVFDKPKASADPMRATVVVNLKDLISGSTPESGKPVSSAVAKVGQWTPIQALLRAGRELVAGRPLPDLFQVILNLAIEASGAERGVLMTLENGVLVEQAKSAGEFHISSLVRDKVIADGESLLIFDASSDAMLQHRQSIVLQNVHSLMAVPLQTEDRVIGLIYVDSRSALRPFVTDDLNLLTVMANVAAIRIERQRLALVEQAQQKHRMEMEQAAEIQRKSLPETAPVIPGYIIGGKSIPCFAVGGDYYDFYPLPDGRLMIVIGDVAGKGMPAALLVMSLQANAMALSLHVSDIGEFVRRLNDLICPRCPEDRFVTFFSCILDPATGEVVYCNAGHNPPLVLRADGRAEQLPAGGLVLGLFEDMPYSSGKTQLAAGDQILLYTDGITETENRRGEEFDLPVLEAWAREHRTLPAGEFLEELLRYVDVFSEGLPAADDRTVVTIRRE